MTAAADRAGAPADADFRIDQLPANTHLCIDAVGAQHFIFKTTQKRAGLRLDGSLAALGPVRLVFSTIGMGGVSRAVDEFSLLTEIMCPDPGKAGVQTPARPRRNPERGPSPVSSSGTR